MYILIPVLVVLMALVLISLFRGLNAFRQSLDENVDNVSAVGATDLQLKQNRMMWARIKYQAIAVIVVGILLAVAR